MFDICLSNSCPQSHRSELQSSHIPHNETDLSYNLVTVPVLRQLVRALPVFLTRERGRLIEQFPVQRTALGENSLEIVVIISNNKPLRLGLLNYY